jgi:predicted outer membrane lipoprotein
VLLGPELANAFGVTWAGISEPFGVMALFGSEFANAFGVIPFDEEAAGWS